MAQAEARRSSAIADLNVAQSNLKSSRATYEQVIGHPPSNLVTPPSILHVLPQSLDEAMTLGDGENPVILGAVYQEEASLYAVNQIIGELLPQVSLEASYTQRFGFLNSPDVPGRDDLEAGGHHHGDGAGERAAVPRGRGRRPRPPGQGDQQPAEEGSGECAARVHADVVSNWGILQSTVAEIKSAKDAVDANKIALEGVQEEEKVGQRTTLDVLNAQLEYLTSQIGLVTAERDRLVAEYSLYAAVGRLDAQSLGLSVPYYDPIEHYDNVTNKWIGLTPPPPPAPDE